MYSIAKIQNACLKRCLADSLFKLIHLSWFCKCIRTSGIFDTKEQITSFFCASKVSWCLYVLRCNFCDQFTWGVYLLSLKCIKFEDFIKVLWKKRAFSCINVNLISLIHTKPWIRKSKSSQIGMVYKKRTRNITNLSSCLIFRNKYKCNLNQFLLTVPVYVSFGRFQILLYDRPMYQF